MPCDTCPARSSIRAASASARWFGELTLHDTRINQQIDGVMFQTLRIPYLKVLVNTRKLLRGELDVREVDVVQPSLRLCQRRDGTWNLQGLLASPWPGPWLDKTPPILIEKGTIELVCSDDGPTDPGQAAAAPRTPGRGAGRIATILRDVSVRIEQDHVGAFLYRFDGSAGAMSSIACG